MAWKLWIDDQLNDPETPNRHAPVGFVGVENNYLASMLIGKFGPPEFMDLDHDLGDGDNVMEFLKLLANMFPDGPVPAYNVHSENPVGKKNIESFMDSWKRSLE